jgi:hypothetical protein
MRQRTILTLAIMITLGALLTAPSLAQEELGEKVNTSIDSAVNFLWTRQLETGGWEAFHAGSENEGLGTSALIVYALLEAGVSPQDARMLRAFEYLKGQKATKVYSAGMRAVALQVANEQTNNKYLADVRRDVDQIRKAQRNGAYAYDTVPTDGWDNSNTQYAVLAAWYGGMNDRIDIPSQYWTDLQRHWQASQKADGGWSYNASDYYGYYAGFTQPTMTVGGIASLYICEDNIPLSRRPDRNAIERCEGVVMDPNIAKGLAWMDANFTADPTQTANAFTVGFGEQQTEWAYYYLYGVERAGIASGYKYFGGIDWYKAGAEYLINHQTADGSWIAANPLTGAAPEASKIQVDTALSLLFLIRGRQPLLFNKLEHSGDWNNRSRDLAAVTHWLSRNYEYSVNWQIVDINSPIVDWRDAPFMYISGKNAVSFDDVQIAKLRDYVYKGGTILSTTQADGPEFKSSIREFYKKAFPDYDLVAVPDSHPLYNKPFQLEPGTPTIYMVSNGVRPLAIHIDNDISLAWMGRDYERDNWAFNAIANITLYTVDTLFDLNARGVSTWPEAAETAVAGLAANPPSWMYILDANGGMLPVDPAYAGQTVDLGDGAPITIPNPDDADRVTVYCEPTDQYINIPRSLLGQTLPTPDGAAAFVAVEPEAPNIEDLMPEMPYYDTDMAVIRLKNKDNAANCNPEPYAWARFAALMEEREGKGVWISNPVDIADLVATAEAKNAKLAVLTGTEELELTNEEQEAIKSFISSGGTVFIDAAGGSEDFSQSFRKLARRMYRNRANKLVEMSSTSTLFSAGGKKIRRVKYRRATSVVLQTNDPQLSVIIIDDRPGIIFSDYDLTAGLVGYTSGCVDGYTPESAYEIMRNLILMTNE